MIEIVSEQICVHQKKLRYLEALKQSLQYTEVSDSEDGGRLDACDANVHCVQMARNFWNKSWIKKN